MLSIVLMAAVATGGFLLGAQRSATDQATDAAASGSTSSEPAPTPSAGDDAATDRDPTAEGPTTLTQDPRDDTSADPGRPDRAGDDDRASTDSDNDAVSEPSDPEPAPTEQELQTAEDEHTDTAAASTELVSTVERYVGALDRGDLSGAHGVLAPELTTRPGWSLREFVDFWEDYLVGADLLEVIDTDQARRQVTAQVDFFLTGDGLSRERITLTLRPTDDGALLISDYEVARADRLR